ncbi:Ankyrin repeat protein [Giardia duodenalis]|uniref:Ankyrin repeat protein n=1 Tax=Giardia intestinalis TaxID=5741 RepID=V6TTT6_GIAIN|nr:Ankyrin repeat protein [Giardia intestinalis]
MKRKPIYDCGLTTMKLKMLPNGLDDRRGDANAGAEFVVKSLSSADKTAPMRAAERDHIEVVRVLVKHEARAKDRQGHNALYHALKSGHMEIAKVIMEHDEVTDKTGTTALMRAADRNDVEMVELLIPFQRTKLATRDVRINGLEIRKGTALMRAAAHGYARIVELLVEHEGGMRKIGWPALMLAAQCDFSSERHGEPFVNHPKCVKLLAESEGSISKWTELMYAAYRGDVDTVRSSLHMKGERDIGGWTALMRAAEQGHEQVVELLTEERGMTNNSHQTALMWAARNGHPGCVRLLLEKEGGMLDKYGGTALMFAVEHDHIECIKLLLEKEAGMRDKNGWTALMRAVLVGHTECVRLLAEEEKDMKTIRERFGYLPGTTALDIAKREGRTELVSIFSG